MITTILSIYAFAQIIKLTSCQADVKPLPQPPPFIGAGSGSMGGYACALTCTFQYTSLFANVFNAPLHIPAVPDATAIGQICKSVESLNLCMNGCPADSFRGVIGGSLNGLSSVCTTDSSPGNNPVVKAAKSCIDTHFDAIGKVCRAENEKFLAATTNLKSFNIQSDISNIAGTFTDLCQTALDQARCFVPTVGSQCNAGGAEVIGKIIDSSVGSFRKLMENFGGSSILPAPCRKLFDSSVVKDENNVYKFLEPTTTTVTQSSISTTAANTSTSVVTTVTSSQSKTTVENPHYHDDHYDDSASCSTPLTGLVPSFLAVLCSYLLIR